MRPRGAATNARHLSGHNHLSAQIDGSGNLTLQLQGVQNFPALPVPAFTLLGLLVMGLSLFTVGVLWIRSRRGG